MKRNNNPKGRSSVNYPLWWLSLDPSSRIRLENGGYLKFTVISIKEDELVIDLTSEFSGEEEELRCTLLSEKEESLFIEEDGTLYIRVKDEIRRANIFIKMGCNDIHFGYHYANEIYSLFNFDYKYNIANEYLSDRILRNIGRILVDEDISLVERT